MLFSNRKFGSWDAPILRAEVFRMTRNHGTVHAGRLLLLLACLAWAAQAQQGIDFSKVEIKTTQVADGLYELEGQGGNITVSVGADGILLVDSQWAPLHQKIMDAVRKISQQPIRFLIDTHYHGDHTDGNALMAKAGATIVGHENLRKRLVSGRAAAPGVGAMPPAPKEAIPVMTYNDTLTLHFNGEEISLIHTAPAHTDGDTIIYFRRANVISTGDLPASIRYPNIDVPGGGSVSGNIAALERMMKLGNPNTKFIPGHGPISTVKDLEQQRQMLIAVRDRVQSQIRAGKNLDQIVAAKPTAEFDEARKGGRTPEDFLKLVYADLSRKGS